ncbi:MAG: hypothetical protein ACLF0P_00560 [Thermoanaerobaculia bacterium]
MIDADEIDSDCSQVKLRRTKIEMKGQDTLPMRRLSRRPEGEDTLRDAEILLRTINRLRGPALIPRGLYRFSTHEEADEWMIREMARTHARRSSKTS